MNSDDYRDIAEYAATESIDFALDCFDACNIHQSEMEDIESVPEFLRDVADLLEGRSWSQILARRDLMRALPHLTATSADLPARELLHHRDRYLTGDKPPSQT